MERGIVRGYEDGSFRPDRPISRAEFVALVNRAFGFSSGAFGEAAFRDLDESHWAYRDVQIAVQSNYISGYGDGTFRPDRNLTRQEAAVIASRLLIRPAGSAGEAEFRDRGAIADWAKDAVNLAHELGILSGYEDGTFRPDRLLTRAEAVVILDRVLRARTLAIETPGIYGPAEGVEDVYRDVVVRAPGVQLRNMVVHGDLTISEEVGEGDVFLSNIAVRGHTYVYGGGENSIHVVDSFLVSVTVDKKTGGIRIVVEGASSVAEVVIHTPATVDASQAAVTVGSVKLSENLPPGSKVTLTGSFETVEIAVSEISVEIPAGAVENLVAGEAAEGTTIELGAEARIAAVVLEAVAKVTGAGTVEKMTVSEKAAAAATIEVAVAEIVVPEGVEPPAVQRPQESVSGSAPEPAPVLPPPSGGPAPPPPPGEPEPPEEQTPPTPVADVALSGVLTPGETISAEPAPAGATVQFQWQRADEADGEFADIEGATESSYEVRPEDEGKWIRVRVTGTGGFTGTAVSPARKALPAGIGVAAQDFGVVQSASSGVIGYNVGFRLLEAAAADAERIVITLYSGEDEVARVISSERIMEEFPNVSVLSAPFDVLGSFDYEGDGYWDYSGWTGPVVPDKAVIRVEFLNGAVREAVNTRLTGNPEILQVLSIEATTYFGNPASVYLYFDIATRHGYTIGSLSELKLTAYLEGSRLASASLKKEKFQEYAGKVSLGGSFRSSDSSTSWDVENFAFDGRLPDLLEIEYTIKGNRFLLRLHDPYWINHGYLPVARMKYEHDGILEIEAFSSIQDALDISEPGDYRILVDSWNYGDGEIWIRQKEGVNLTLQGLRRDVVLKNPIRIDGAGRWSESEMLTIRNFTFDFSGAGKSGTIISATDKDVVGPTNNYAHNLTIEDVDFIGTREGGIEIVAVKTTLGTTFGLTIRGCTGTGLHSLGQLHVARGFTVENCKVENSESGISYYGTGPAVIRDLTVDGENYGVRAGQGSGTPRETDTLTIENSDLKARYPIYLRGDAPMTVYLKGNTTLNALDGGEEIHITVNPSYEIRIIRQD